MTLTPEPTDESSTATQPSTDHWDVLVVGAGIAGIAAAHYLSRHCTGLRFRVLEARERVGGTWDLFRYPGLRSDSDLYTFGYSFNPWTSERAIAAGHSILEYLQGTAVTEGLQSKCLLEHRLVKASWSSKTALWTVQAQVGPQRQAVRFTCNFLLMCTGYYDYAQGYLPRWPEQDQFKGTWVHPQAWPEKLDYAGKRLVVVGSGATAMTLVPALAKTAAHVTLLQRSPTYVLSRRSCDSIAKVLFRHLPPRWAQLAARWKNILAMTFIYRLARRHPDLTRAVLLRRVKRELGPGIGIDPDFLPRYDPFDQRLCVIADSDLFVALRAGRSSMVTGTIERFTATGLQLYCGRHIEADIVVTATGLNVLVLGGADIEIDGRPLHVGKTLSYQGMMFDGVPNFAVSLGYSNASWTLKCEVTARYVCRLLNHMKGAGFDWCMPQLPESGEPEQPLINLTSGYLQRAADRLPRQGSSWPWRLHQNYALDALILRCKRVNDGVMRFSRRGDSGIGRDAPDKPRSRQDGR